MNPELLRNLWLEATPFRLVQILGLLVVVFAVSSAAPRNLLTPEGAAMVLYWFFVVLWGTRNAALSVVGEIRERTWDGQKLSAISPGTMMWGKLLGATSANWFGGLLCLLVILVPAWRESGTLTALSFGVILLALGLFAQAVALLSSLVLIRRNTGNWRLDTFLCQIAGIGAAFAYYSLWSSVDAFEATGTRSLIWWGHEFGLTGFHFTSLLIFLGWALLGVWRAMRAELRFANGPFFWLAYLAYLAFYSAGFESWLSGYLASVSLTEESSLLHAAAVRLGLASLALLSTAYSMVFLEPKDPVRLRWLGEQFRAGHTYKAFLALDAWMLSYGVIVIAGLVLVGLLAMDGTMVGSLPMSALAPGVLAMLGFLTRDVAIFVLMRGLAGNKGDFAALALLAALYLVLPAALHRAGLDLQFLLVPVANGAAVFGALSAWTQGLVIAWLAARSMRAMFNAA
jgi:hypothetical protein